MGQGGREVVVRGRTPPVSHGRARLTSDLHRTDGLSVALHVWHARCVRQRRRAPSFEKCAKQLAGKAVLDTTAFSPHLFGLRDLRRPRGSVCLPSASPSHLKEATRSACLFSSSGSPRMGEMMRSTGGAEDSGGQAAAEITVAV